LRFAIVLLRVRAAASSVRFEATGRAEPHAIVVAQERERKRGVDELPGKIWEIELVADQDVAFAERVVAFGGLEPFFDVEVQVESYVVEAAGASALGRGVDAAPNLDAGPDPTEAKRHLDRSRKSKRRKVGEIEGFPNVELSTRVKDAADVDVRANSLHCRCRSHVPVAKRAAARTAAKAGTREGNLAIIRFCPIPCQRDLAARLGAA